MQNIGWAALALVVGVVLASPAAAQALPAAIDAPGKAAVLRLHAQGAQIYICQGDAAGALRWAFREPIAALLLDGKTLGRHYGGPTWELTDGGTVQGKVLARAPGASPSDIPWLKLEAVALPKKGRAKPGPGLFRDVALIQRINTEGGALEGECPLAGALRSVAYSADYVFLRD